MEPKVYRILLAEDSEVIQKYVVHKLQKNGFQVTSLSTGEKVVETMLEIKPSLLILDLLLPVKNGQTILSELKSNPDLAAIPVIIFTTNNNEEMLQSALKLGAVDYILKPFSSEELISKTRHYSNIFQH